MIHRRRVLTLLAAVAATPLHAQQARTTWRGIALGADVSITLLGARAEAEAALEAARAEIVRMEGLFSLYQPESALSRLNATGRLEAVPADFSRLMTLVDRVHGASGGRFDPSVQPLWQALSAGQSEAEARAATRAAIGWGKVGRGAGVTLAPGMALTFNGIAQGFATDAVAELLAARGFVRQLVDIGEVRAGVGEWRIGLSDPELGLFSTLTLSRSALATSSPRAMLLKGGAGHILGPSGEPARWSSVVVEAATAREADALSTAFCLMERAEIAALKAGWPSLRSITLVDARGEISTL